MSITATLAFHAITALAGYVFAVSMEWFVHKYIFHELGKRKGSRFRFHYADHHKDTRRHKGGDPAFESSRMEWNAHGREFWGIIGALVLLSPSILIAPAFWIAAAISGINYHRIHRKSHIDPQWCKEKLPWHWDHHMGGRDATNANWCVTCEWFDKLMGTRVVYLKKEEAPKRDGELEKVKA